MRLSWNEVRARAAVFAEDGKDTAYEKGETQSFYNDFLRVFGACKSRLGMESEGRSGSPHLFPRRQPCGLGDPGAARAEVPW